MGERKQYSDVRTSGIKQTEFLKTYDGTPLEDGLARGHNGFLFSGIYLTPTSPVKEEPTAKEIIRTSGSARGLFNSEEFLFD